MAVSPEFQALSQASSTATNMAFAAGIAKAAAVGEAAMVAHDGYAIVAAVSCITGGLSLFALDLCGPDEPGLSAAQIDKRTTARRELLAMARQAADDAFNQISEAFEASVNNNQQATNNPNPKAN